MFKSDPNNYSNTISESVQKQSDELMLSKTEQISNLEEVEYEGDQSECWDSHLLKINWKKVKFSNEIEVFTYPSRNEIDDQEPIKALHYIGYQKGLAWLKAFQRVKHLISNSSDISKQLTLSKLDVFLEREYSEEVEAEKLNEEKEDKMKEIDDTIEDLKTENELLKLDIAYLKVKQKTIRSKRLQHSRYCINSKINQTFDHERHDNTILTFAEDERYDEKFNESGFNDISNIPLERHDYNTRSLDENEFTKAIDEAKEEDEISDSDSYQNLRSPPLKIESLTNDTSCLRSQVSFAS